MFPNVFSLRISYPWVIPNVYFFFVGAGQIGPIVIKIYNINFNAYTEETQILFEIQGFYFFSNIISKRDANPRQTVVVNIITFNIFERIPRVPPQSGRTYFGNVANLAPLWCNPSTYLSGFEK